jgi:hypothetical protein
MSTFGRHLPNAFLGTPSVFPAEFSASRNQTLIQVPLCGCKPADCRLAALGREHRKAPIPAGHSALPRSTQKLTSSD